MQSIDSLRELNAKLLAKIAKIRKENAELKDKNAEIPDLKRKFAEIKSKKVELKARIAELLRQAVEESKRRDVENAKLRARIEELEKNKKVTTKLESENAEFRDRITKVEQRQMLNGTSSNNSSSNFNSVAGQISKANSHHEKPLVNKEMDTSLPEELIPKVIAKQSVSAINISVMD
jgi:DNA repair exonuclease SbcCD ATPase subunit